MRRVEAAVEIPERPGWTCRFPLARPDVRIARSEKTIDEIDCRELLWWFVVPDVGNQTAFAYYEVDTLQLAGVTEMVATMPARVHQVDCVEIQVREWSAWRDWPIEFHPGFVYGRIDEERTRWVAVIRETEGTKVVSTFADDGFEDDWGVRCQRRLRDDGRFLEKADGSYGFAGRGGGGAGVYDVSIGASKFNCLRVLDLADKGGELVEAYVERGGRTVFSRRYDGRFYRGIDLSQRYPDNRKIRIDDIEYVQCDCTGRAHDTITGAGTGLDA